MQFDTMASLKARFRLNLSVPGVLETLLKKGSDFLLSGRFFHYAGVQVGYSAFTVNERFYAYGTGCICLGLRIRQA